MRYLLLAALVALAGLAGPAGAEVFYAKDEALALAFPGASVVARTIVLTEEQVAVVKERAGVALESRLVTYYTGVRDGAVTGFAIIDSHVVRTLPEVFMATLTPEGAIDRVVLLAFYEPHEYLPPARWLEQFNGRGLGQDGWRLGRDLHGISGATLTAQAVRDGLRKVLALHDLVIRPAAAAAVAPAPAAGHARHEPAPGRATP
jgi:hypothetical protein